MKIMGKEQKFSKQKFVLGKQLQVIAERKKIFFYDLSV